jgi:hypothetical protein
LGELERCGVAEKESILSYLHRLNYSGRLNHLILAFSRRRNASIKLICKLYIKLQVILSLLKTIGTVVRGFSPLVNAICLKYLYRLF